MNSSNNQTELGSMLGDRVTLRKVNNRLEVTNRRKRKPSTMTPELEAAQDKFLEATQYAKDQVDDNDARALYATGITESKRSAYQVAISDCLIAPRVHYIKVEKYFGKVGNPILVKASDDFMVTQVNIVIRDSDGNVLEQAEAKPNKRIFIWKYTATAVNPSIKGTTIEVIASDRPGNETTLAVTL